MDQFTRHFSRRPETHETEATVKETRKIAADLVLEQANITHLDEKECMFACMPLKHTEKYQECFHLIYKWLNTRPLFEFPVLSRFFQDTYKKAYVSPKPILWSTVNLYDSNLICESAPPHTCGTQDRSQRKQKKLQLLLNRVQGPLLVSLSGGVDSMVMVALAQRLGLDVECVHIVYGNRSVSQQEFSLITDFCTHINVKLWVYEIEWLKRAEIDRAFYESMTRTLRFAIYKTFPNRTVLLGHIQDDVIENIWTNFAKGQQLENLAKMTSHASEDGVRIGRPWLQVDKADIYKVAEELHIPHLKKKYNAGLVQPREVPQYVPSSNYSAIRPSDG